MFRLLKGSYTSCTYFGVEDETLSQSVKMTVFISLETAEEEHCDGEKLVLGL